VQGLAMGLGDTAARPGLAEADVRAVVGEPS
jgi:hypothetical protein